LVAGQSVHQLSETRRSLWRGLNLGVVYQFFQLMPMLSLQDNVTLPMDFCGLYRPGKSEKRAEDLLRMVELEDHIHKLPSTISGGQAQRVAIARALANDPPILIADEPTGSLDSSTAATVLRIFANLVENGKTLVMVSHDRSISEYATRIIEIEDGQITEA
jgi:putative ABC transport system ATP-binding protein